MSLAINLVEEPSDRWLVDDAEMYLYECAVRRIEERQWHPSSAAKINRDLSLAIADMLHISVAKKLGNKSLGAWVVVSDVEPDEPDVGMGTSRR